jgi:phosphatidate cytidylyltransferase
MAKPKAVKFQHQHRANGGADARRQSSSTDASNEPGSPRKELLNGAASKEQPATAASEYEKKKQTFITRTIWTLVMILGFFGILAAGHVWVLGLITVVVIISFKEVIAMSSVPQKQKDLPLTRSLDWYFFAVTMYYLYGESVLYYFKHILLVDKVLLPFATHHRFISFMMYLMGKSTKCL